MHNYLDTTRCSGICKCPEFAWRRRGRVRKYGNLTGRRNQLQQDFLPLAIKFAGEDAYARSVASRIGEGPHQTRTDHVVCEAEYRNYSRGVLSSPNGGIAAALNGIHLAHYEVCRMLNELVRPHSMTGPIHRKVARLNEAQALELLAECHMMRRIP
jgi:hypothetical protein